MSEQGKVADPVETPSVDDAAPVETPAEPEQPSPEQERVNKLEGELGSLKGELEKARAEARESGRRAQSAADSHASRLEKRIERLNGLLTAIASQSMTEPDLRAWKLQQELDNEREARATVDTEAQTRRQQEDFQTYSAQLLAEEGISSTDPVLMEAWGRFSAQAKDPSDWKPALVRAVAEVRKAEAKTATERAKTAVEKALEDERNKAKNKQRESSGPVDNGAPGSRSHKPIREMTAEEFAVYDAQRENERRARQMARM